MAKIAKNHDEWSIPEPPPLPTPNKRGVPFLNPEDMQEAKKSIKEKGIRAEDVKNLPPIETLCEPTTHPPMVEVHSLYDFTVNDIPYSKPPSQCLDEFDNFIVKQTHFNMQIQEQLNDNTLVIKNLYSVLEKTANDVKGLVKHFHMVQTQLEQITIQRIEQSSRQAYGVSTRGGITTQDPLYPEGHPKRIEEESQLTENNITSSPKRKKKKKKPGVCLRPILF